MTRSYSLIAGIDEVGRGPLAGPVVAAAVVLPPRYRHPEITDSKQLSRQKREDLSVAVKADALDWSIVSVSPQVIEVLNILQATRYAMSIALQFVAASEALIDGNTAINACVPQQTVVQGDSKHVQIGAASIIAKVWRDSLMCQFESRYPEYGFAQNAGYGTKAHRQAIADHGISGLHRRTFHGVAEYCDREHPRYAPYPFEDVVVVSRSRQTSFTFFRTAWRGTQLSLP